nr:Rpn family recombination-promoting nuclease/putative transposase [Ipomoea batatas]
MNDSATAADCRSCSPLREENDARTGEKRRSVTIPSPPPPFSSELYELKQRPLACRREGKGNHSANIIATPYLPEELRGGETPVAVACDTDAARRRNESEIADFGLHVGVELSLAAGLELALAGVELDLAAGLEFGLAAGLELAPVAGLEFGLAAGLELAPVVGLEFGLAVGLELALAGLELALVVGLELALAGLEVALMTVYFFCVVHI